MASSQARTNTARWQTVALPTEHGGWGFISEPLLLGLLLAPTWGGLALAMMAFGAFLLRHPLKLVVKDRRKGRIVPRTLRAQQFVMLYGGVMLGAGGLVLLTLPPVPALIPLLLCAPLIGVQLWQDMQNKSRSLSAELAGALATGAFASTLVMLGGWELPGALALWLALAIKGATAVLYVRARLRLEREQSHRSEQAIGAHWLGLVILIGASVARLLPWTAPLAMLVLTLRAGLGLSAWHKPRPPKVIGFQEIGYGLGFVLALVIGYALAGM
ncbi:MAG: YwiC-like family protein [Anaerolineae bacterium]